MEDKYSQYDVEECEEGEEEQRQLELGEALVESLRYMGSFSQRSLKYFDETASAEQLVAKKLPPIDNIMISKNDFKADVRREYDRVPVGQMRQIVAATGVGKSTIFPSEIVNFSSDNGLILSPRSDLSFYNGRYLSEVFLKKNYKGVQAVQLRSEHVKVPEQKKTLYYDTSPSFFMMLAIYPSLLQKLNIKFILFDESHENTGDYRLADLLASAGKFRDVKVFKVSATRANANMEHEIESSSKRVVPVPLEQMDLSNIESLTQKSPLHYSRINSKALVFVPELSSIMIAKRYYERYDIPVYIHTSASSSKGMVSLAEFLTNNEVAVVLTDKVLDTGFTYAVVDAYCCGYTSELVIDLDNRKIDIVKKPVTMSVRKQRGGRISRLCPGTFYFADVESTEDTEQLSDTSACYLALWCKLFNITTNLPEVTRFKEYFGPMTHRKVMMLLHCHVHPILANPYMDMQGNMCHGWEQVFNYAVKRTSFQSSEEDKRGEIEADWVFQNIFDERFLSELESIKVPLTVPEQWSSFFYAVWKATDAAGQRWPFGHEFDRRSVLSVAPADMLARKKTWYKPKVARDSSATLALDSTLVGRLPVRRNRTIVSPVSEEPVDLSLHSRSFSSEFPDTRKTVQVSHVKSASLSKPLPPIDTAIIDHDSKRKSVKIDTAPIREIHSPVNLPSLSDYKAVKASTLHIEKIFPYHVDMLTDYIAQPTRRDLDIERVEDMCNFKKKLHDLSPFDQRKHLLSVIRCWNYNVLAVTQIAARKEKRPLFFRTVSKTTMLEQDIDSYRQLLITMELEGFRVAVKRSGRHTSMVTSLTYVSSLVKDRVDYVKGCLQVLKMDGVRVGLYLYDSGCILGLLHVFENDGKVDVIQPARFLRMAKFDDLIIMGQNSHPSAGVTQLVREPVEGEKVYLITVLLEGQYKIVEDVYIVQTLGKWFHTASCVPSMSGAAIVAADDGKLIGLHLGASIIDPDFPSAMVALHQFVFSED